MSGDDTAPNLSLAAFARFAVVGGICFLVGLVSVYLLTTGLGVYYLLSTAISLIGVNILGWLLNRSWTFGVGTRRSPREFLR
jgi:putative flippase GtrA